MVTGKTIWVLGATSDLGRALILQLASNGNYIVASARSPEKLQRLAQQHNDFIKVLPLDIVCNDSVALAKGKLQQLSKFLDIVVYCTDSCETITTVNELNFKQIMEENLFGLVRCLQLSKFLLLKSQSPQLAIITNLVSGVPQLHSQVYGAANAAMDYFIQSIRDDKNLAPLAITSVKVDFLTDAIPPGVFPFPFGMSKQLMAEQIIKAISSRKAFLEVPSRLYIFFQMLGFFKFSWINSLMYKITHLHGR